MSYHIYTTDGIVLKRSTFGEADLLLYILTNDLGMVVASARSARVSASKLRPGLQEFSEAYFSCIKSKNGWKVTNVSLSKNIFFEYPEFTRKLLARVAQLVVKMVPGEQPDRRLFTVVKSGLTFLRNINEKDIENIEAVLVLRILFVLGYVEKVEKIERFIENLDEWSLDTISFGLLEKKEIVGVINKALKASQL